MASTVGKCVTLLKREPVLGGYDPENYQAERLFATAPDGTQAPISLVYRKGGKSRPHGHPLWLTGYGAYGYSLTPSFSAPRTPPPTLDATTLAPGAGLEIFRYARRFVQAYDRVKSLRCRACVHTQDCDGVHTNWVRAHGFAPLQPQA
jgi:hypothetical protein